MAWTAEDRRKYAPAVQEMVRQGMLGRLATTIDRIDPPSRVGRPRLWSTLIMLQALWHRARDGCAWRRLPPSLPPHQSVWSRFSRWRLRAVLDRAGRSRSWSPAGASRRPAGRRRRPPAAIIDTQSVKAGPRRGPRGYDAHKKTKGRKRVLMIGTQGGPLGARVVPADTQDRDALESLAPDLAAHASLLLVWLDRGFAGGEPCAFLQRHHISAEIVGTPGRKGFQVEPRRGKVEQTFGCLQRYRRLRVDDEASLATSRAMTLLASVFMTGMRLERMLQT
jgi:putative transposase